MALLLVINSRSKIITAKQNVVEGIQSDIIRYLRDKSFYQPFFFKEKRKSMRSHGCLFFEH